jgi:hypothetical protein
MSSSGRSVHETIGLHRRMDPENQVVDDGALLQDHPAGIGDRSTTEMGRDPLEQLVDIVERVAAD